MANQVVGSVDVLEQPVKLDRPLDLVRLSDRPFTQDDLTIQSGRVVIQKNLSTLSDRMT